MALITGFPTIRKNQLNQQLKEYGTYIPENFARKEVKGPLRLIAAIQCLANTLIRLAITENYQWSPQFSTDDLSNEKDEALSSGWKLREGTYIFSEANWYEALDFLVSKGYVVAPAQGKEYFGEKTYRITPKLANVLIGSIE